MKKIEIIRVYLKESEHHVKEVLKILEEAEIKHAVAFRAIEGEGMNIHILSFSLDLPIIIEFFDTPDKIQPVLPKIHEIVSEGHIIKLPGELVF